jgi:hypothetical protein
MARHLRRQLGGGLVFNVTGRRIIEILLNGTTQIRRGTIPNGSAPRSPLGHICVATATRPFVAGDALEMQALQASGGALNVEVLIEFSPIVECYVEPS